MFGTNCRTVRPDHFVGHAGAAAGLVDGSSDFGMVHNARKGIWNLKDKTSCELSILAAGVYETGSVRQELTVQHDLGNGVTFPRNFLCVMPKFRFGRGLDECAHF